MVKSGPHLVNHLARKDRNLLRRLSGNIQLLYTLRLCGNLVRLASHVFLDGAFDSAKVFFSSGEFEFCRREAAYHDPQRYQR